MSAPQLENFTSIIHRSLIEPNSILFGSRLLGTARADSDIDLVVVSRSFHRVGLYERRKLVQQAVTDLNWQSDVLLRTPAEWEVGGFLREMVESQLNAPDEWRRLFDARGQKIGYRDILASRLRHHPPARREGSAGAPRSRLSCRPAVAPSPSLTGGPGDLVKIILDKLGIKPIANCGCGAMRQRMNEWGYSGCWAHRDELVTWFSAKATEAGINIDPGSIAKLVAEGVWQWIVGRSERPERKSAD